MLIDKRFGRAWTEGMIRSVLNTAQADGVIVDRTRNVWDTREWIEWAVKWTAAADAGINFVKN